MIELNEFNNHPPTPPTARALILQLSVMVEISSPTFISVSHLRETLGLIPHACHDSLVQRKPYWQVIELRDFIDYDDGFRDIAIKSVCRDKALANLRCMKSRVCICRVRRYSSVVALRQLSAKWARLQGRDLRKRAS